MTSKAKKEKSYRGTLYENGRSINEVMDLINTNRASEDDGKLPRNAARAGFEKWFRSANMFPKKKHAFVNEKYDAVMEVDAGDFDRDRDIGEQVIFQMKFSTAYTLKHQDVKAFDFPEESQTMELTRKDPKAQVTFKVTQVIRDLEKNTRAVFILYGVVLDYKGPNSS